MLNDIRKPSGNIHIIESQCFPCSNTTVLLHFRNVLLDDSRAKLHALNDGFVVDKQTGSGNGQRLLHHYTGIVRNLCHIVPVQSLHATCICRNALCLSTIECLNDVDNEVLSIALSAAAGSTLLRNTKGPVHLLTDTAQDGLVALIINGHLLIVEPFQCIHHRKGKGIVLCHAGHMVGKHIEDTVHNDTVLGLLLGLLGKAHVQQCIQACCTGSLVRIHRQMAAIGVDGEVILLAELLFAESGNRNIVAPLAALLLHELLQVVSNLFLSGGQLLQNRVQLALCKRVSNIGDFLSSVLEGCHSDTFTQNVALCLLTLAQLIQRHDLRNTHLNNGAGVNSDGLHFILPGIDFRRGVGLFGKLGDLLGVECQGSLATAQTVIDCHAALAKSLKGIGRSHLLPQKELGNNSGVLSRFQLVHMVDGVVTCVIHMLEHSVHMESVHLHDVLFQGTDHFAQLLKLLGGHLVNHKLPAVVVNDLLGRIHETAQVGHKVRRQVRIIGVHLVHIAGALHHLCQAACLLHHSLICHSMITTRKRTLALEVDAANEGDNRILQGIRDMLHDIFIVGMQHPVGKLVHIAPQAVTVLLDGIGIVAAVSPAFQGLLVLCPLLLFHHFSGLLQHTFQNSLFLHIQDLGTCLLDLTV